MLPLSASGFPPFAESALPGVSRAVGGVAVAVAVLYLVGSAL